MAAKKVTAKDGEAAIAMLAKERKQTRREAIASGQRVVKSAIADVLAGAPADDVAPAVEAAVQAVAAGATFITLTERDRIRAEGSKALIARIDAGTLVRPNGKPATKFTQDEVLPKYFRNFLLAVDLTPAMRQSVVTVEPSADWGWGNPAANPNPRAARTVTVQEKAPAAPKMPSPETVARRAKVAKAAATVEAIDALPGPEHIVAIGTPEAQDALETLAAASIGADREDAAE